MSPPKLPALGARFWCGYLFMQLLYILVLIGAGK
jgi:hypothetical protein